MIHRTRMQLGAVVLAAASIVTIAMRGMAPASSTVVLDVPGRADETPGVAASGSFVAVAWGAKIQGKTDVFLAVSGDGGASFGPPVQVNATAGEARLGGELPPRVALVSRPGATMPEISVVWTARGEATEIKLARSRDGGKTFSTPVTLSSAGAKGAREWAAVVFDRQAGIHAIWLDHRGTAAERTNGSGHAAHEPGAEPDGGAMAGKSALYYASVGARASNERELTKGVCYCCKTALAAGSNGYVYAAWRHVYPGNLRDIAFTSSRDGGRSFASPVRVSEDGWAINGCTDDGPAMAVDASGTVHLVWPTVIGGTAPEGAIFYASTRDGQRFTPRIRVPTLGGPKPSHPQIALDAAGRIFVTWDESVKGRRVAAVRELRLHRDRKPAFGEVVDLSPNGPATYPVLASTGKGIVAVWTAPGDPASVHVRVLDLR